MPAYFGNRRGMRSVAAGGGAVVDDTLTLNIALTSALPGTVTFTRASTGSYFNSSGVLSSAAIDAARFDYDPSTLVARGQLFEEQRTNYLLHSNDFSNAAWLTYLTGSKVGAGGTGPDGNAAYEIAFGGNADGQIYQSFTFPGGTFQLFFYVRAVSGATSVRAQLYDGGAATISADQAVTDTAWTRIGVTAATGGSGTGSLAIVNNSTADAGNVYVASAQLEIGDFPTSWIPTTTIAVTRAADIATMTGTDFSDWYVAATGTFVVEFDVLSIAAGTRGIVSADNNTANERIELYNSTADPKAIIVDGGATQADLDGGTLVANTSAKLGLSYAANDAAACLNGGAVATDVTVTLPTPDRLRIGVNQAGTYLNGHVKSIKYYNVAKTDAELQSLTT
jgi:hypothetical protein